MSKNAKQDIHDLTVAAKQRESSNAIQLIKEYI